MRMEHKAVFQPGAAGLEQSNPRPGQVHRAPILDFLENPGTGVATAHSDFVGEVSGCHFQKLLMVLLLGIMDLLLLLLCLPARGGILLFSPSLKLSQLWDGVGTQGGSERFFDIQSPRQRPPCCCGAAEQLWGGVQGLWKCSAGPIPELRVLSFLLLPACVPQNGASPQEPPGPGWEQWEGAAVHARGGSSAGSVPSMVPAGCERFCGCSRSLRSKFQRWSVPICGTGGVPALPWGWRCCW